MSYWVESGGFLKLLLYYRVFQPETQVIKVSYENRHPIERIFSDEFSIAQYTNPYDQTSLQVCSTDSILPKPVLPF